MSSTFVDSCVATVSPSRAAEPGRPGLLAALGLAASLLAIACAARAGSSGVVLEYHHVATDTPPSTSIDPARFEAHMDHLAENDFHVWPLPKLVEAVRAGEDVPDKTVALTFDDAYASVYTEVFPRMQERGWPFTIFVTPGYIDKDIDAFVTWEQLREMQKAGATIANHSQTHPHMAAPKADESRSAWLERVRDEITEAQDRLEAEVEDPPMLFAYPYGEFSPPVQRIVSELDYVGFGQQSGAFGPGSDFTALPRFPLSNAFASLDSFKLKVRSRPLPVRRTEPESGVVEPDTARPELRLTLGEGPFRADGVRCYIGGKPADIERVSEAPTVLRVQPTSAIGSGRTKYNCTAPPKDGGGWFWYSFLWMKPLPDGSWYTD